MSNLSPRAEELLRLAREKEAPRAGQKALVRAALAAALPTAVAGAVTAKAAGAVGAKATSSMLTTVVVGSLVGAGVVGGAVGVWSLARPRASSPPVVLSAPAVSLPAAPAPIEAPPAVVAPPRVEPPARPPRRIRREPVPAALVTPPPETPPTCTLADELELLRQGQAALGEGAAQRALHSFERHRERCRTGTLGEEREAGRIMALCALKRVPEAEDALRQFRVASPRSPQLARLEQALREASGP